MPLSVHVPALLWWYLCSTRLKLKVSAAECMINPYRMSCDYMLEPCWIENDSLKKRGCLENDLLWRVDPDNVQVAVIHTLLVFVSVACASLYAPPGPWQVTGRTGLRFTVGSNAARQNGARHDLLHLPPLVHIFARWGTYWVTAVGEAVENFLCYVL